MNKNFEGGNSFHSKEAFPRISTRSILTATQFQVNQVAIPINQRMPSSTKMSESSEEDTTDTSSTSLETLSGGLSSEPDAQQTKSVSLKQSDAQIVVSIPTDIMVPSPIVSDLTSAEIEESYRAYKEAVQMGLVPTDSDHEATVAIATR